MNIKENFDVIIFFTIIKYKIYYFFNYLHRLAFYQKNDRKRSNTNNKVNLVEIKE